MIPRPKIVAWLSWLALKIGMLREHAAEAAAALLLVNACSIFLVSTIGSGI